MHKVLFFLIFLLPLQLIGQPEEYTIKSRFVEDSVKIGKPVHYYITVEYANIHTFFFPDSTLQVKGWEWENKAYVATRIKNSKLYDSVIYAFRSFELSSWQYISLPIILWNGTDSIQIYSPIDSIAWKPMVDHFTDTTQVKADLQFIDTPLTFNRLYWSIGIGFGLLLLIAIWLIFGKKVIKYFKIKQLRKRFDDFGNAYQKIALQLEKKFEPILSEKLLVIWKNYLEETTLYPYSSATTKEIVYRHSENKKLADALRKIDKGIYGNENISATQWREISRELEMMSEDTYRDKLTALQNG